MALNREPDLFQPSIPIEESMCDSSRLLISYISSYYSPKMMKSPLKQLLSTLMTALEDDCNYDHNSHAILNYGRDCNQALKYLKDLNEQVTLDILDRPDLLHAAVKRGHYEIVRYLFDNTYTIQDENLFLYYTIDNCDNERVKLLLDLEFSLPYVSQNSASKDGKVHQLILTFHRLFDEEFKLLKNKAKQTWNQGCRQLFHPCGIEIDASDKFGKTALHHVNSGDIAELLCNCGADINAIAKNGSTPLHEAVKAGNEDVVRVLLQRGAETDRLDNYGQAAIHNAASVQIANLLLKNKASVDILNSNYETALYIASRYRVEKFVEVLLEHGADANRPLERHNGDRALHYAASKGTALLLLTHGADVNARNTIGETALHRAIQDNRQDIVPTLLSFHADVNISCNLGQTSLHFAQSAEMASLLLKHGAKVDARNNEGETAILIAQSANLARILFQAGSDLNVTDRQGRTALHRAAKNKCLELASVLLELGADPNALDGQGRSALNEAMQNHDAQFVSILLKFGADVNGRDEFGRTALIIAAQESHREIVSILLEYNADVDMATECGKTALYYAINSLDASISKSLIEHGANSEINFEGVDLLRLAASHKLTELVEYLLPPEINVNLHYKEHFALHRAASFMNRSTDHLVYVLIKYGYNVNELDAVGKTPLHFASSRERAIPLLKHGARVDIRCKSSNDTCLHSALRMSLAGVVDALLEYGANPNEPMGSGTEYPLTYAILNCRPAEVEVLLKHRAELGPSPTNWGSYATPLHLAANTIHCSQTVHCLIKNSSDIDERDGEKGYTALHYAIANGNIEIVQALLSNGADINVKTNLGVSAFELCPLKGVTKMSEAIETHIIRLRAAALYVIDSDICKTIDSNFNRYEELTNDEQNSPEFARLKKLHDFKLKCINEVEKLRNNKLTRNISLHGILLTNNPQYVSNETLIDNLVMLNLETLYPIYAGWIKAKYEKDRLKSDLLPKARLSFNNLIRSKSQFEGIELPSLPIELEMKIIYFLDNRDLKNMIQSVYPEHKFD